MMSLRFSGYRDCGPCGHCGPQAEYMTDADSAEKYGSEQNPRRVRRLEKSQKTPTPKPITQRPRRDCWILFKTPLRNQAFCSGGLATILKPSRLTAQRWRRWQVDCPTERSSATPLGQP